MKQLEMSSPTYIRMNQFAYFSTSYHSLSPKFKVSLTNYGFKTKFSNFNLFFAEN